MSGGPSPMDIDDDGGTAMPSPSLPPSEYPQDMGLPPSAFQIVPNQNTFPRGSILNAQGLPVRWPAPYHPSPLTQAQAQVPSAQDHAASNASAFRHPTILDDLNEDNAQLPTPKKIVRFSNDESKSMKKDNGKAKEIASSSQSLVLPHLYPRRETATTSQVSSSQKGGFQSSRQGFIASNSSSTAAPSTPPPKHTKGVNSQIPSDSLLSSEGFRRPNLPPENYPLVFERNPFFIGGEWNADHTFITDQIYVERIVAKNSIEKLNTNLILIHGDHHEGSIWHTKPDGGRGWSEWFAAAGYDVYVMDCPFHGRSSIDHLSLIERVTRLDYKIVENEWTAPEKSTVDDPEYMPHAQKHTQWPGTGLHGDPIWENYFMRLRPEYFDRVLRQNATQLALYTLLLKIGGNAVLVGHGSGATAAMLALDATPELILTVVAIEPIGPPFAQATRMDDEGNRIHLKDFTRERNLRPWGIADISLTYNPVANMQPMLDFFELDDQEEAEELHPIPHKRVWSDERKAWYYLQDTERELGGASGPTNYWQPLNPLRRLTNISKRPVVVITGEASPHILHDWATVEYLKQAGVQCFHLELGNHGIHGNGHLCHLEKNSDVVADCIFRCVMKLVPGILDRAEIVHDDYFGAGGSGSTNRGRNADGGKDDSADGDENGDAGGSGETESAPSSAATILANASPAEHMRNRKPGTPLMSMTGGGKLHVRWQPADNTGSPPEKKKKGKQQGTSASKKTKEEGTRAVGGEGGRMAQSGASSSVLQTWQGAAPGSDVIAAVQAGLLPRQNEGVAGQGQKKQQREKKDKA